MLSLISLFQILETRFSGLPIFIIILSEIIVVSPPPLTSLTLSKTRFGWSRAAQDAFDRLKGLFTSAPIIITPDPEKQFIVEVDASDVGVGAILSQRSSLDDKVHPCAFYCGSLESFTYLLTIFFFEEEEEEEELVLFKVSINEFSGNTLL